MSQHLTLTVTVSRLPYHHYLAQPLEPVLSDDSPLVTFSCFLLSQINLLEHQLCFQVLPNWNLTPGPHSLLPVPLVLSY